MVNSIFGKSGDNHAKIGIEAADRGDFHRAIQEINIALQKGTKKIARHDLLTTLGRSYQQLGNYKQAISACKEAIKMSPDYSPAWNNLGLTYKSMGDFPEAEKCYIHSIKIDPNFIYAYLNLGLLYITMGKAENAKRVFQKAIQINPNISHSYGNLALSYAMLGDFEKAHETLKRAISLGFKSWKEIENRIQALAESVPMYQQQEQYKEALEPIDGIPFTRYPTSDQGIAWTKEADKLMASGNRREAVNIYKRILNHEPNCSYVLVQYGLTLQEEGRVAEAIRLYVLALKIDPEFGYAYYARGWAKHFLGDFQGELNDAKMGLGLDPQNPGMYLRRMGAAYHGRREFSTALEVYSKAIELNPNDEGTIYNKGLCYFEMTEFNKAIDEFTLALSLDPGWDWALVKRAEAFMKLGENKKALEDINEILSKYPGHGSALELYEMLKGK